MTTTLILLLLLMTVMTMTTSTRMMFLMQVPHVRRSKASVPFQAMNIQNTPILQLDVGFPRVLGWNTTFRSTVYIICFNMRLQAVGGDHPNKILFCTSLRHLSCEYDVSSKLRQQKRD